jgi:hypothetical protein
MSRNEAELYGATLEQTEPKPETHQTEMYKRLLWLLFDDISEIHTGRMADGAFDVRLWAAYKFAIDSAETSAVEVEQEDEQSSEGSRQSLFQHPQAQKTRLRLTATDRACIEFLVHSSGGWLDMNDSARRAGEYRVRLVEVAEWERIFAQRQKQLLPIEEREREREGE